MEELPVLLDNLKSTVECLSISNHTNTWEVCGGLDRLFSIMINIFRHGCLSLDSNDEDPIWHFIQGINWLHPMIDSSSTFFKNSYLNSERLNKSSTWIYKSLENYSLSEKLGWLLSDKDHLYKCYKPEAFLRQKNYSDAALLCLKAIELNQPSLLLEIDPKLYLNYSSENEHCTTLPKLSYKQKNIEYLKRLSSITDSLKSKSFGNINKTDSDRFATLPRYKTKHFKRQCHKSWPDIYFEFDRPKLKRSLSFDPMYITDCLSEHSSRSITMDNPEDVSLKLLDVNYEQLLNENIDLSKHQVKSNENKLSNHNNSFKRKKRRSKLFSPSLKILEESDDDTRSNISDGSRTLIPYDEMPSSTYMGKSGLVSRYFPGQDLFKCLFYGQFVQANAELDRENAHFNISEAIIGTIEQIKCNQKMNFTADEIFEESDEEINRLKQRICYRRKQKHNERINTFNLPASFDYQTESTPTDHTMSSLTSSRTSTASSLSTTDDTDDFDLDNEDTDCLSKFSSMSSLYSNIDFLRSPNSTCSTVTAESVARSLLRQFNQKTSPVNTNIQWLISESDAPQEILPFPSSWPVNPHEPDDHKGMGLRGTSDWAPPRPQIIFTTHPPPIRKNIMERQGYKCAGCSITVAVKYASKFRYCFYLGRYFCTGPGCHTDKTAFIPGRIISKWDFSKYPVSDFSFNLIEQILVDPFFNISDLNSSLYKRARGLERARTYRLQLYHIKDFILSCRYAESLKEILEAMEAHIILEPDLYSIKNMLDVKNGELCKKLRNTIVLCDKHITNCQLCQARGFVCELCDKKDVLFPWNFRIVTRCVDCGSCYHKKCFDSRKIPICPRCPRITAMMFKRADCKDLTVAAVQS